MFWKFIKYLKLFLGKFQQQPQIVQTLVENITDTVDTKVNKEASIALVNKYQGKFSETFVRQHVIHLPYNVHYLFGKDTYFPRFQNIL